jgi:hypothetical protein
MNDKNLTMLADAPLSAAERRSSLIAVIACITVVGMGLGVSIPLLALLMERNGVPASVIGLNTAMPALANTTAQAVPMVPAPIRAMVGEEAAVVMAVVSFGRGRVCEMSERASEKL